MLSVMIQYLPADLTTLASRICIYCVAVPTILYAISSKTYYM